LEENKKVPTGTFLFSFNIFYAILSLGIFYMSERGPKVLQFHSEAPKQSSEKMDWGNKSEWESWSLDHVQSHMDSLMHHLIDEGVFDLSGRQEQIHSTEHETLLKTFESLQHTYKKKLAEFQRNNTSKTEAQQLVPQIMHLREHSRETQEMGPLPFFFADESFTVGQIFRFPEQIKLKKRGKEILTQDIKIAGLSEKGNLLLQDVHTGTEIAVTEDAWKRMRQTIQVETEQAPETLPLQEQDAPHSESIESRNTIPEAFSGIQRGDVFYAKKRPIPISPQTYSEAFRVVDVRKDGLIEVEDLTTKRVGLFDSESWVYHLPNLQTESSKLTHEIMNGNSPSSLTDAKVNLQNRQEAGIASAEKFFLEILPPEEIDITAFKRQIEQAFFAQFGIKIKLDLKHGKVIAKGISNRELNEWYATNPFFEAVVTEIERRVQLQAQHTQASGFWSTLQRDGIKTALQDFIHRPKGKRKAPPPPDTTLQRLGKKRHIQTAALGLQALAGVAGSLPAQTAEARPNTLERQQQIPQQNTERDPQAMIFTLEAQLRFIKSEIEQLQRTLGEQQDTNFSLLKKEVSSIRDESGTTAQSDALFETTRKRQQEIKDLQREQLVLEQNLRELKENSPKKIREQLNFLIGEYHAQIGDIAKAEGNVERAKRGYDLTETKRRSGKLNPADRQWTQADIQLAELELKEEQRYQNERRKQIEELYTKAQSVGIPKDSQVMTEAYTLLHPEASSPDGLYAQTLQHEAAQKDMQAFLDKLKTVDEQPLTEENRGGIQDDQEFEVRLFDNWAQQFLNAFNSTKGKELQNLPVGETLTLHTQEPGSHEKLLATYTKTTEYTYQVDFSKEDGTKLPFLSASILQPSENALTVTLLQSGEQRTFRKLSPNDTYFAYSSNKNPNEGPDVPHSNVAEFAKSVEAFAAAHPKKGLEVIPPPEIQLATDRPQHPEQVDEKQLDKEIIQEIGMRIATPFIEGTIGETPKMGELDTRISPVEMNVGDESTFPYTAGGAIIGTMHLKKLDHGSYSLYVRDTGGKPIFDNVQVKTAENNIHIQFDDGNEVTFVKSRVSVPAERHDIVLPDGTKAVTFNPPHETLSVDPTAWYEEEYRHELKEGRVRIGEEILKFVYGERLDSPELLNSSAIGEDVASMRVGDSFFLNWNNSLLKLHKLEGEKFEFEVFDRSGEPLPNLSGDMSLSQNGAVLRFEDGTGAAWVSKGNESKRGVVSIDEIRENLRDQKKEKRDAESSPSPDELALEWGETALPSNIIDTFLRLQPGEVREVPTPDKKGHLSYERVSPDTMYVLEIDSNGKKKREFEVIKKGNQFIVENLLRKGTGYVLEVDDTGEIVEASGLAQVRKKGADKKWEAFITEITRTPAQEAVEELFNPKTDEQRAQENAELDETVERLIAQTQPKRRKRVRSARVEKLIQDISTPEPQEAEPMEFPTVFVPDSDGVDLGDQNKKRVARAQKRLEETLRQEELASNERFAQAEQERKENQKEDPLSQLVGKLFYEEAPPQMTQKQVEDVLQAVPKVDKINPEKFWGEMRIAMKKSGLRDIGKYPGEEELKKRFENNAASQPAPIERVYHKLFPGG